jgi:hypothetical protein
MLEIVRAVLLALVGGVSACALVTDLSGLGGDAGIDGSADVAVPIDAPSDGFVLTTSPTHLTMDVGDSFPVALTLTRGGAFTGAVNVTVNQQQPPYLVASNATISGTTGTITVSLTAAPSQTDYVLDFLGSSADGTKTSHASVGVHIGSLLLVATSDTTLAVPSYAYAIDLKAWGAGGAGGVVLLTNNGGAGGGGGFVSGAFPVTGGETLSVLVGAGGHVPGGGGGFSGVQRGTTFLAIAGGGGGGGAANNAYQNTCATQGSGGPNGAAGGGASGETRAGAAGPGTQTAGGAAGTGATAGTSLQGGCGATATTCSSVAHGGAYAGVGNSCGGGSGGGGGGGYFGGGGGDGRSNFGSTSGGGGGSGYLASDAGVMQHGTGPIPASSNDPDWGDAGAGGAGGLCQDNGNGTCSDVGPTAGQPGRVVVRLVKP